MTIEQRRAEKERLSAQVKELRISFRASDALRREAYKTLQAVRDRDWHAMQEVGDRMEKLGFTCPLPNDGDVVRLTACTKYWAGCEYGLATYRDEDWPKNVKKNGRFLHLLPIRQDGRIGVKHRRYHIQGWEILEVLPPTHPLVKRVERRRLAARLGGKEWPDGK